MILQCVPVPIPIKVRLGHTQYNLERVKQMPLRFGRNITSHNIVFSNRYDCTRQQKLNNVANTAQPHVSDHPKCEELVVGYGRWSLTRVERQEVFYERTSGHIYLSKRMYCTQFLGCNICKTNRHPENGRLREVTPIRLWKTLVLWISSCSSEVDAYETWSHKEVFSTVKGKSLTECLVDLYQTLFNDVYF